MPRDRRGRFTAERTTETTTRVTERLTVEEPAPAAVPPPSRFAAAGFAHLLSHPPPGARWAHPAFIAGEAARAAAQMPAEPFTVPYDDTAPVAVITVPRVPYPQLAPATLDHEFTEADQERLAWKLSEVGEYLP